MIWVALAAQLSAPVPIDFLKWWSPDDMPAYHQINGVTRWLTYRVTVKPDGSIQACDVEISSSDRYLDSLSCNIIKKRAKLAPAKWTDGSPVQGVFRAGVTWAVGDDPPPNLRPPDLTVKVDQIPKRARSSGYAKVMFAVDEHGRVSDCAEYPENERPELVDVACQAVIESYKATAAAGPNGYAVRSVQNAEVKVSKK